MEELRQQLIKVCNESGLPIEAIYFVVKDVYRDVNETLEQYKKSLENRNTEEEQKDDN